MPGPPEHLERAAPAVDGSTTAADAGDKKEKKKDKVRSAWISFAGRIVAQIVGAAATIVLGLLFVQKYQSSAERASGAPAATTDGQQRLAAAGPLDLARGRQQRPAGVIALAVLPLENFSGDPAQEYFADGMTEALITDLAQIDGLHVISRTSSMHYTRAKAAADRALALDSGSAEAHTSLASVRWRYDWDWAEAEREFHRALELNPGYATAHSWYAIYLAEQGRHDEAAVEAQRALQLDPLSNTHRASGIVHYHARRFDLAETAQRRALALEPASVASRLILAWTLVERGNPRGAIDVCTEMAAATPDPGSPTRVFQRVGVEDQVLATLAYAHARMGDRKSAEQIGRRLLSRQPAPTLAAALPVHVALGDGRAAIAALDRAITERSGSDLLTALKVDPLFDQMRPDPRFAALLARLKLS